MSKTNDATRCMQWAIETVITRSGYLSEQAEASDLAVLIMEGLRESMGGGDLYLPRIDREQRDQRIRSEFTGANHALICERYGISRSTLYRILSHV